MRRIDSLRITNFQRHEEFNVEFPSGLTVIIGPSNVGKSAIVRAMQWAMLNVPLGDGFITDGQMQTRVELVLGSDDSFDRIVRVKSKLKNYLKVNDETFNSFGREYPIEVRQHLGLIPSDLGNQSIFLPISPQIDLPFMVGFQDTAKAAALDNVSGSAMIRYCVKNLNKDIQVSGQRESILTKNRDELQTELDQHPDREILLRKLRDAEMSANNAQDLMPIFDQIDATVRELGEAIKDYDLADYELGGMAFFDESEAWNSVREKVVEIDDLQRLATFFDGFLGDFRDLESEEDDLVDDFELPDLADLNLFEVAAESYRHNWSQSCRMKKSIETISREIGGLELEMSEMIEEDCPLCGVKLTQESRDHILRGSST